MEDRVTKKIVLDPYRGGDDIGNTANDIIEKDYNLEITKYIYDRLRSLGVPVSITRDSDETLDINNRINRIRFFYGTGNDVIVVSNALTTGGDGAEIVYALRNSNTLANKLENELKTAGKYVSKVYQRRLPSDTSKDYNQLIRDTKNNESIIIYYGNIDNAEEANFLKENLEELGEAIVIALTDYLDVTYQPISGSNYYIVKKGDSLYSIANQYNTTVGELKDLNNLSTNILNIGQVLKIPAQKEETSSEEIIYTVKNGDSLYSIARTYNTTVDAIKALNNLSSDLLSIGQVLKIPSSNEDVVESYITYQVKKGDSLYSIARTYNTTADAIKTLNNLNSDLLSIGQVLKIPNSDNLSTPEKTYITYKVVSGDTLYSIARNYNTTVDAIKNLNNLTSNTLTIGQTLKIPTNQTTEFNYITYTVVSGDSLYSIAKKFNTTVNNLKEINNLSSNLLSIGQILKVPKS